MAPVYIRTLYGDDPSFRESKIVTALFNDQLPGPLDARLAEKMHMDGIPKNALKPINGKELDYDGLMAYSLKYCDAVIACEPDISANVLEAAQPLPCLQLMDDDVSQVKDFYASLFE